MRVKAKQCRTCIYHPGAPLDLSRLEKEVSDPRMAGHFSNYRNCHEGDNVCCRGFYNRHRDHCTPTQIAHRLGIVLEV